MCGIYGYVGSNNPVKKAIEGLKKLEYRGYDSAGIAGVKDGKILSCKEVGKVSRLEEEIEKSHLSLDVAISHTRWATHGEPSQINAHPHFDDKKSLAVVHNGIIENYQGLKDELKKKGVEFLSDTDTEVVAHLISHFYKGDLVQAVKETVQLLKGAFALAIVHKDHPDSIVAVAHESPMVIGIGNEEAFIASDPNSFAPHTRKVVFLSNSEIALVKKDKLEVFSSDMERLEKKQEELKVGVYDSSKGQFEHYTLKEIFEQPQTIRNALSGKINEELGTAVFTGLQQELPRLGSVSRILILACGTSWHAGYVASYLFEEFSRIPVQVEISSEFRYKNPILNENALVIAISQSGETADTLAAVRELKAKGAKVLALCNVQGSSLARESDYTIFLNAGPEVGVCSTKAFTSQLTILSLLALLLARMRHLSRDEGVRFLNHLNKLPDLVKSILEEREIIRGIAKKYSSFDNFFFLGRQYMYPTALEGALKLKEISYINANGYPAGEMKHGPIALINPDCPTVALTTNKKTYAKMLSNIMEVKARKGPVIAIASKDEKDVDRIADDVIFIPETIDSLSPILATIATQLLAYYIAYERGESIDQPRNLAKSVTVE
ncbi:glutamine--fructose-6-phosphate transaminase (isomerizing) [Criblamydia sequanensis]|uniref:Glutamine--fructose-6-phosphate aminotransferase [isomerizing] n=1 Tax=Candidatus Criblamydia sequanensis CRIB-18 TaxID=1437425 RepID=A0A090D2A1_9BACT|nr:glutamine--fructose-6-phosphate transaminase (isomerizing) [Criblamydia sequanensis]CDR34168.1 Glucosamine--fructose-6-phosphate aminotransferase [isomerizing] [Criblamydia sequanensis CRIB-18]